MSKNINPDVKKMLSDRIAYERKLSEKSKIGYDAKRKTQALVTGTLLATTLGSSIAPVFADSRYEDSNYKGIGYISVSEEVGSKGNGATISSGKGDAGGVSYGLTQLSTNMGSADKFVDTFLKENYPEFYKFFENADKAGTKSFNEAWLNAYDHNPGEFERIQLENKEVNYVNPARKKVKEQFGVDLLSTRARTEFLHSTAVQFGPDGVVELFEKSGVTKDMDDEELLSKLCDEKYNSVGTYKFKKCDSDTRNSVRERFIREKKELVKIAQEEKGPLLDEEIDVSNLESESTTQEFVETAKSYLNQGTTYKMGGKNTKQLDCSGYVSLVYQDMGIDIDEMMTNAGKLRNDTTKISRDEIKEGDLVFWHDKTGTKHASVFHVGIYVGDDTVVDCSTDHNGVGTRKLSSLQDNSSRYYTFGRYEELQEKMQTDLPDIYLDLSEFDEFEADIEVSESVEEKFENESTEEDTTDEDNSVIDEEVLEENTTNEDVTNEDDSVIDEDALEEDTTDKEITDEDNSVVDDEALEENTTNEDITDEDDSVVDEDALEDNTNDKDTIEEDDSIIDDETLEENTTNDKDNSAIDEDKTNEENSVENDNKEQEDSIDSNNNEGSKEDSSVEKDSESKDESNKEVEDNVETEKESSETTTDEDIFDVKEDNSTVEEKSDNNADTTLETTDESKTENTSNEVKEDDKEESTTTNILDNDSTTNDTQNDVEKEVIVASSSSEAKIQELEKKLENNLFAKLFRG